MGTGLSPRRPVRRPGPRSCGGGLPRRLGSNGAAAGRAGGGRAGHPPRRPPSSAPAGLEGEPGLRLPPSPPPAPHPQRLEPRAAGMRARLAGTPGNLTQQPRRDWAASAPPASQRRLRRLPRRVALRRVTQPGIPRRQRGRRAGLRLTRPSLLVAPGFRQEVEAQPREPGKEQWRNSRGPSARPGFTPGPRHLVTGWTSPGGEWVHFSEETPSP